MAMNTKLHATPIALYTEVSELAGGDAVSVAGWIDSDGMGPAEVFLRWTNAGAAAVTIGDAQAGEAAQVYADGALAGVLFAGREVTVDPGGVAWCEMPRNLAALGSDWSISAPLASAEAVSVTIEAFRVVAQSTRYYLDDNVTRNGQGLPTQARRRFFATAAARDAATPGGELTGAEVEVATIAWTYTGLVVTSQRGAS